MKCRHTFSICCRPPKRSPAHGPGLVGLHFSGPIIISSWPSIHHLVGGMGHIRHALSCHRHKVCLLNPSKPMFWTILTLSPSSRVLHILHKICKKVDTVPLNWTRGNSNGCFKWDTRVEGTACIDVSCFTRNMGSQAQSTFIT